MAAQMLYMLKSFGFGGRMHMDRVPVASVALVESKRLMQELSTM